MKPMFHLKPNPSPPALTGCDTPGQAVDSSAIVTMPGTVPVGDAVHALDERHRFEVLVAALLVRDHVPAARE